ncbi:MAG: NCS2 family permease [Culicoidibacterales bacterium]
MFEKYFKLTENGTTISTEIIAGATTFFTMAYILFVNPAILSLTGMPTQAVFLATIISAAVGTLIMGLFANVPYAQAPGMGLNAFFTYTVCFALGFSWQEGLALVFLCGLINILITVTKLRKVIIKAIPESLQHAIGGGIGLFIAYVGLKSANLLQFVSEPSSITAINGSPFSKNGSYSDISNIVSNGGIIPEMVKFANPTTILAVVGLILTVILLLKQVKGAIIIVIITITLLAIPLGVVDISTVNFSFATLGTAFGELGVTFGAAFGPLGFGSLLSNPAKFPLIIMTVFAFSLSDTFDTIGTFIGTGRKTGIFNQEDEIALENGTGFKSKMDRALFADAIATSIGAIVGTSNTTTFVESAAGIGVGGRTGLTSVVTAILFLASAFAAPIVGIVPAVATAPALIVVGIMMLGSFAQIKWHNLAEAVPAFFASVFMAFSYNISYGIATGFIFYCIIKVIKGEGKTVHPVLYLVSFLFVLNFAVLAILT